jgi:integrase
MHNDFTLFMRTYPNGTKVVFYHAYDDNDRRVGPWTTKCKNLTAARNYCNKLLKAGELVPDKKPITTFAEFAEGFWDKNSEYVRRQESRADITDNYLDNYRQNLKNQIIPFFGNVALDAITEDDINKWLIGFRDRGRKLSNGKIKNYKNSYANNALSVINIMMTEAVRRKLIASNPCENVRKLKNDSRTVEILTADEVKKLFPKNAMPIWGGKEIDFAVNRLASLTGMRIGEIMGLRGEYVFEGFIRVCGQYGDYGYKPYTKTKENRNIPLLPEMMNILRGLMKKNGSGFVFSQNGGVTPVDQRRIRDEFHRALKRIGLTDDEIKKRGLTPHSWRHFVNTELQLQGLTVPQVQAVTGHSSERMTEHYSHIDARQISDITKAQAAILGSDNAVEKTDCMKKPIRGSGLKLVKLPERKNTDKRKQA